MKTTLRLVLDVDLKLLPDDELEEFVFGVETDDPESEDGVRPMTVDDIKADPDEIDPKDYARYIASVIASVEGNELTLAGTDSIYQFAACRVVSAETVSV